MGGGWNSVNGQSSDGYSSELVNWNGLPLTHSRIGQMAWQACR